MRHAFTARGMIFPNEGRIKKVKRSMKNVKKVAGSANARRVIGFTGHYEGEGTCTCKAAADLLPPRPPKKVPASVPTVSCRRQIHLLNHR